MGRDSALGKRMGDCDRAGVHSLCKRSSVKAGRERYSSKKGLNQRMDGASEGFAFGLELGADEKGVAVESESPRLAIGRPSYDFHRTGRENLLVGRVQTVTAMKAFEAGIGTVNRPEIFVRYHDLLRLFD